MRKDISIIIVTYNVVEETLRCLRALMEQIDRDGSEIIIVDNASEDGTVETVASKYPHIIISTQHENLGFARAVNRGISISKGETILFLNPDTVPLPGFLERLQHALAQNQDAAAVGPRAYWDESRKFLISCLKIPTPTVAWLCHSSFSRVPALQRYFKPFWETDWMYWTSDEESFRVPAIGGAYCLVRRRAIDKIGGGFAPEFFLGYEDVDLAVRFRERGWEMRSVPSAEIVHYYGASKRRHSESVRQCEEWGNEANLFIRKNYGRVPATAISSLLRMEAGMKKVFLQKNHGIASSVESRPSGIHLEWLPEPGVERYLVEIATAPGFFDKYGAFTTESHLDLEACLRDNLSKATYFFRVLTTPLGKKPPVATGRFEVC